ncbi:hypothetical protein D9615_008138 [Tricholomella constricta]|uniref:Cytosolic endo-beta-N-acetylglucosaminidase TIM barrel domain-containing protein n=1 Tax=Tricholomella constricta TaxID=117010 RepID=A0A8H5LWC6_9AGAR|nr:hypothetical protein D9615_008138 [Tricholomella constricta]
MSRSKGSQSGNIEAPYFSSLKELDAWAAGPNNRKLDGTLEYVARPAPKEPRTSGKLLVCHDYKGGYTESPNAVSYTYNFWSSCDAFVYFSHHRITIPPPGWITAAHRQGVKMLGTLIFEGDGEEDCLRLLVGNLPTSVNGPAKSSSATMSLPLSPHYAKLLAELAWQRGFDGYLLNFECPLRGGVEQCRTLAAWITVLQAEILAKVGSHGETIWYDSVIFTGDLAWQDRLNSLNLPFFLSSTGIFSNYTWPREYPDITAEYFLALDPALTGNASDSHPHVSTKFLNDIYMGVDVWGRGSHGGGGFGSYKAITHIAPQSLGLSVALFGQAWTWESEQDKPGWTWEKWWQYESKLWFGPAPGGEPVEVPDAPRREGEPECAHGPFESLASFFPRHTAPDPFDLPLHTTFSPGVGRAWFVNGVKVHQMPGGWTDVDKQCTVGDMVWPRPLVVWQGGDLDEPIPEVVPAIFFEDAWNAGSSLKLALSLLASEDEDAMFRCIWVPVQSVAMTKGRRYEAKIIYKADCPAHADVDIGLSMRLASGDNDSSQVTPVAHIDDTGGGWSQLTIQFSAAEDQGAPTATGALGLIIAIVTEDPSQPLDITLLLGQLNVFGVPPPGVATHTPALLWADFSAKDGQGTLTWEVAAAFPPLNEIRIKTPNDPVSAWAIHPSNRWFPHFVYFNIYALLYTPDGRVGQPEQAAWIGTTGWDGQRNRFGVGLEDFPFSSEIGKGEKGRFYVQGVTDHGVVLRWEECVFVDFELDSLAT